MSYLIFFFLVGILIGAHVPVHIPLFWGKYVSVCLLAALDSVLGAGKSVLEGRFYLGLFVSGFITNTLLAGLLTYVGDRIGVELYLAAIVTFGVRIFQDFSMIRLYFYKRFSTAAPQGVPGGIPETK